MSRTAEETHLWICQVAKQARQGDAKAVNALALYAINKAYNDRLEAKLHPNVK